MGLDLTQAYHRQWVQARRNHNHDAAYVFNAAQRVLNRYSHNLTNDEQRHVLAEFEQSATQGYNQRECEAWATVIEIYHRAAAR